MTDTIDTKGAVTGYLQQKQEDQAQGLRASLAASIGTAPDNYADAQRIAQSISVPVGAVLGNMDEAKKQAQLSSIDTVEFAQQFPRTAAFLSNTENAKVAHDNMANLGEFERLFQQGLRTGRAAEGKVGGVYSRQGEIRPVERTFLQGLTEPLQRGYAEGKFSLSLLSDPITAGLRRRQDEARASAGLSPDSAVRQASNLAGLQREGDQFPTPDKIARGMEEISGANTMGYALEAALSNPRATLETALQSFGTSAPMLATAAAGSTMGPFGTAAGAGAGSFAVEYGSTLKDVMTEKGMNPSDPAAIRRTLADPAIMTAAREKALKRGIPIAIFDALTGGLAGKMLAGAKPTVLSAGGRAVGELALQAGGGAAGEATAQAVTGEYKPGDILMEALAELPTAFVEVPGNFRHAREHAMQTQQRAEQAQRDAQVLGKINEMAAANQVLQRSPDTFQQFIAQATENGPVQAVYIDAKDLMQSGVAEQVAAVSPAVAAQLETAAKTGGQIAIPVDEYTTKIAPTQYAQTLLDHLKTDAEGFSQSQAREYMQNHAAELQQEMERTLAEKQGDDSFKQSAEAVRAEIRKQLDEAGRFTPQVNDAYSSMVGNFFAVTAAKLGTTPEQFHQQYPLRVGAEAITSGQQFDQGGNLVTGTPAFKNWFGKSKVVSAEGKPLRVYHGTDQSFDQFVGETWFTPSAADASTYANMQTPGGAHAPNVMPVYLSLRKPKIIKTYASRSDIAKAKASGKYDGVIVQGVGGGNTSHYVAFNAEQVKSAIGNNGNFNPNDANILHQSLTPDQILALLNEADTIQATTPQMSEQEINDAEARFLSAFPEGSRYPRASRLLERVRRASEKTADALGGDETKPRNYVRALGPFSQFEITADVLPPDSFHPHGQLAVQVFGKEQVDAGLTAEPALTFTVSADGELTVNGPPPSSETFAEFKARGWADYGRDAKGEIQLGWSTLKDPAHPGEPLPIQQILPLLADVHARARAWRMESHIGLHWSRATGALGGLMGMSAGNETAVFFQDYNQKKRSPRDDYTLDLFDVPASGGKDQHTGNDTTGRPARRLSRDDAPGTYTSRTELVQENTRQLGTDRVSTPDQAAQALAYLGKGAVERLDALITDKDGKPLAIVGAFKGALTQASVYPSTLVGEAFRVDGAANIWFAHNHPSGNSTLSEADRNLTRALADVFRGSEIKAHGLFAIAGKESDGRAWSFMSAPESRSSAASDLNGTTSAPNGSTSVPVVERVYTKEDRLGPKISSPDAATVAAKSLAGDQSGVIMLTAQNEPVAFVPVNPAETDVLRRDGRMDALYRALSISNAGSVILVNNGNLTDMSVRNLAGLFNSVDTRVLDVIDTSQKETTSWASTGKDFAARSFEQTARGSFNPDTLSIALLKNADLSTFLHESGHFFLEVQADIAARLQQEATIFGIEALKPGERQILADMDAVLKWFGVRDLTSWHAMDIEEKRHFHEQYARGFEAYLFEGKAPSIELQGLFQRFRAWMLNVYRDLKNLNVELSDEVRGTFDRMLASTEQIQLAEQARSMMPLFTSPDQAGMTPDAFADYQALGVDATNAAIQDLQARGLRDMQWLHNARGREIKRLQKESKARRAEVQMGIRREVMSQPLYRAWQFLTAKLAADDKITAPAAVKSDPNTVDPTRDSLLVAIAKLGGIARESARTALGVHPDDHQTSAGVAGKPVFRKDGGLTADNMAAALAEDGYLPTDEHGKHDLRDLEDRLTDELDGVPHFSDRYDYSADVETRAGDQVANPEALNAGRLDMGELTAMHLPVEILNTLKAHRMTAKAGLHPDIVADLFGFTSGDELVRKLAAAEAPRAEIDALTDVRMLEQYGELTSQGAIEKAADHAIHNDVRARMVATEANALAKAAGQRGVLTGAAKSFAAAIIGRLKVRNIKPGQYASAEARAAKAAEKASKAGDIAQAAAEKRNQLVQNYATRAAYDAQEEVDKGVRYLNKFDSESVRKGLDSEYTDQIDSLLERFDLRRGQSLKAIDKRAALAEWLKAQREAGFEPDIPPALENEALRMSYKDLTVEEFRGLVDTVKQIEHLGRLKHKLLTAADQRAYEVVRDEIAGSIREHANGREADTRTPTTNMGRAAQGLKRFWAAHIKAATWARVLDGGKDGGPMWEYFVRSANTRGDQETTMRAEATAKLSEILAPVFKLGKMGGKGQYFEGIGRSLNREARLAIALNTGNEGNLQRLLGGEGWTMQQLAPVLQSLTAREWRAVQAVWKHFESYREQIGAKERRVYGKEPEWVQPSPFAITTVDGQTVQMEGGYYPIKYDPAATQRAEEHADAEGAKRQLQGAYTTATTRRSFTKARVEEVSGRPLLYTLSGLYSGVNDVIHDLAWHEWLIDANRLLRSQTIDTAIREHYGPEAKQQFKTWAADIAEGDKGASGAVDMALSRLRQGVSAAGLGFNVMSAAMQPLGITQSMVRVGVQWVGRGIAKYLANPVGLTREVNAMSSFMENRARTRFRELNELRNQVQDQSALREITGRYAYFLMMRFQQMVDVPTWWGAYEKAIATGNDDTRAIALADQAVIDAQGGGQTKDLSAIERGGPAQRLFTVFYSFMNTALNAGVSQTMTADTPAKRAKLAADYLLLYVAPPILGYFLKAALTPGDSGDDDMQKIAKKLAANQIDYLMSLMVVAREFSEAAKTMTGANDLGRDYTGPAGLRAISDTASLAKQAHQGEFDDAFRKALVNVIGDLFALPSAQANRTITGVKALSEGKTSNPAALAFGFQEKR